MLSLLTMRAHCAPCLAVACRLSTLEGVSEERSLMGLQLHQLAHYKGIADALALIFAQLTAFIIDVASAVAKQETCHCETPPWRLSWPRGKAANGVPSNTRQPPQSSSMKRPGAAAAAGTSQPAVQRPSPFAAVAGAAGAGGVDVDAASVGMSVLLSGMERQGSMVSSYLWEKKTGWKTAREMLKREMDASLGSYVRVTAAEHSAGVAVCPCCMPLLASHKPNCHSVYVWMCKLMACKDQVYILCASGCMYMLQSILTCCPAVLVAAVVVCAEGVQEPSCQGASLQGGESITAVHSCADADGNSAVLWCCHT